MSFPLPATPVTFAFQLHCWQLSHLHPGTAVSPCFLSVLGPDQAATMSFASCSSPAHSGQAHQSCGEVVSDSNWCVCESQATDGSSAALCGLQLTELFKKSEGFEHLVTCASSAHPSDGCTQRLLMWMTAVLTLPQVLQLGSGKDKLICCTVISHTAVVLSIARQGSGQCFKGLEEGVRAPALYSL